MRNELTSPLERVPALCSQLVRLVCLLPLGLVLAAAPAFSQNLQTVACPGGGLPNYTPFGIQPFAVGDAGAPLLRHTLTGAASLCNDGTPAVIYIRPAATSFNGYWDSKEVEDAPAPQPERWMIWFHGGGGCQNEDDCLDRWCSATGMALDRASKMSTLGAYDAIHGNGIFKRRPDNAFAGYHHVLLNYCSSDNWAGSDSKNVTTTGGTSYDVEFQGEAIVNDAFTALIAGGVAPDAGLGFWQGSLPSLTTAEEILLVGDSAGGGGLRHHVDRLHDWLRTLLPAETRIAALVDAGFTPALWRPAINWAAAPVASYADYLLGPVTDAHTFWGTDVTAIDASCQDPANAAAHAAIGGSHPEICYDTTFTLLQHVTTPFFVGMDINDTLGRDRYASWGLLPSLQAYWAAQYAQLDTLATAGAGGFANPGVFGPKCNQHVRIVDSKFFTQAVTLPGGGVGLSYHDLFVNWLTGGAPVSQIQMDGIAGPAYTPSNCP